MVISRREGIESQMERGDKQINDNWWLKLEVLVVVVVVVEGRRLSSTIARCNI